MKKIYTLFLLAILSAPLFAQTNNLTFFSETGDQFYIILNGIRQNDQPETNVKIGGLNQPGYKAKIIFADQSLGEFDKNIYFSEMNFDVVFKIKQTKKGKWVCRFQSQVPIAQAPAPAPNQQVVTYNTTAKPPISDVVVTETTTTTTTIGQGGGNENVNMNVNLGGMGINMNVNVNDNMGGGQTHTSTTTTSTTTSSSSSNTNMHVHQAPPVQAHPAQPAGCVPMHDGDFNQALQSITSKSFDDSKVTLAQQITKSNNLSARQVKTVMKALDFEDSRLKYAKFAYDYTCDQNNYYQVNDAFDFESTIDELNNYLNGK